MFFFVRTHGGETLTSLSRKLFYVGKHTLVVFAIVLYLYALHFL